MRRRSVKGIGRPSKLGVARRSWIARVRGFSVLIGFSSSVVPRGAGETWRGFRLNFTSTAFSPQSNRFHKGLDRTLRVTRHVPLIYVGPRSLRRVIPPHAFPAQSLPAWRAIFPLLDSANRRSPFFRECAARIGELFISSFGNL